MASTSRLSTAAQFFEDDGGGSEAISTYDRVSKVNKPITRAAGLIPPQAFDIVWSI